MAEIKVALKNMTEKFNKLPTWQKVGIVGGSGALLYFLFRGTGAEEETEWVINYPYPDMDTTGSIFDMDNGISGGIGGSGDFGFTTDDGFNNSWNGEYDTNYNPGYDGDSWGFGTSWGVEPDYSPKTDQIINQPVKLEENLISVENTNPNYDLYQAQLAYGNATTAAEREAAAKAGQAARAAGATDAGANAYWGSTGSNTTAAASKSYSTYNANQALYNAQVAYGAAKTQAERNAAAAAGQAARAAGATDAGANAYWGSAKSAGSVASSVSSGVKSSSSSSSKSVSSSVKSAGSVAGKVSGSSGSSGFGNSAANRALQAAQKAYGAAKTATERAAAAAAGQAARAAGATDAGAAKVWKSGK